MVSKSRSKVVVRAVDFKLVSRHVGSSAAIVRNHHESAPSTVPRQNMRLQHARNPDSSSARCHRARILTPETSTRFVGVRCEGRRCVCRPPKRPVLWVGAERLLPLASAGMALAILLRPSVNVRLPYWSIRDKRGAAGQTSMSYASGLDSGRVGGHRDPSGGPGRGSRSPH
jgi:hypothetical protein